MSSTDRGPQVAVGVVVRHLDHLLLIRRATSPGKGQWSLPGGRVQGGETLRHAACREALEETGLTVVCGELVGWVELVSETHHFVIFDFEASPEPATAELPQPVAGDDADRAAWVPLRDVAALDLVDGLARFLTDHDVIG